MHKNRFLGTFQRCREKRTRSVCTLISEAMHRRKLLNWQLRPVSITLNTKCHPNATGACSRGAIRRPRCAGGTAATKGLDAVLNRRLSFPRTQKVAFSKPTFELSKELRKLAHQIFRDVLRLARSLRCTASARRECCRTTPWLPLKPHNKTARCRRQ